MAKREERVMASEVMASEECPRYRKVNEQREYHDPFTGHTRKTATQTFMIICDEGWRECIVCEHMYEWAADWLIEHIQGKPYRKPKT